MTNAIPVDDWLRVIDDEYLRDFVREGGASIKFAVTSEELRSKLAEGLEARCRESNYTFVELDAARLRAYMPQDILFNLAAQVDWRRLARQAILNIARRIGHRVDGIDPSDPANIYHAIAAADGLEAPFIMNPIWRGIQDEVFKSPRMARDFRVAMSYLCREENSKPGGEYYGGKPLVDWLTGAETRIGPLRPFHIYTTINRATARTFLESALYWIRYVTGSGTVMMLDNSRVMLARNPKDGKRYYTRAMAVDHYELLREFIDGVDRLNSALIVIATDQRFLDQSSRSRGYGIYSALRTRVMNDVRDRNLVNPIASLVRLS